VEGGGKVRKLALTSPLLPIVVEVELSEHSRYLSSYVASSPA
jgi:hypothetical protein